MMKCTPFRIALLTIFCISADLPICASEPFNRRTALIVGGAAAATTAVAGFCIARRQAGKWYASCLDRDTATPDSVPTSWTRFVRGLCKRVKQNAPMDAVDSRPDASVAFVLTAMGDSPALSYDKRQLVNSRVQAQLCADAKSSAPLHDPHVARILVEDLGLEGQLVPSLQCYCRTKGGRLPENKIERAVLDCFETNQEEIELEHPEDAHVFNELFRIIDPDRRKSYCREAAVMPHVYALKRLLPQAGRERDREQLDLWRDRKCRANWENDHFMEALFCSPASSREFWQQFCGQYSLVKSNEGGVMLAGLTGVEDGLRASGLLFDIPDDQLRQIMSVPVNKDPDGYYEGLRDACIERRLNLSRPNSRFLGIVSYIPDAPERAYARLCYSLKFGKNYDGMATDFSNVGPLQKKFFSRLLDMKDPKVLTRLNEKCSTMLVPLADELYSSCPVERHLLCFYEAWGLLTPTDRRIVLGQYPLKVVDHVHSMQELWKDIDGGDNPERFLPPVVRMCEIDTLNGLNDLLSRFNVKPNSVPQFLLEFLLENQFERRRSTDDWESRLVIPCLSYFVERNDVSSEVQKLFSKYCVHMVTTKRDITQDLDDLRTRNLEYTNRLLQNTCLEFSARSEPIPKSLVDYCDAQSINLGRSRPRAS